MAKKPTNEKLGGLRGSSKKLELEYIRKDGSTLWPELVGTALRDKDGNMIGFTGVTRDITERKQAEEETNAALRLIRITSQKTPLYQSGLG